MDAHRIQMTKSIETRLKALHDKRAALDAQIKKIEAEKAKELRKRQEKREALVGKAIYGLVKAGEWSEQQVLDLVAGFLTRAADRNLFGLDEQPDTDKGQVERKPKATRAKRKPKAKAATDNKQAGESKSESSTVGAVKVAEKETVDNSVSAQSLEPASENKKGKAATESTKVIADDVLPEGMSQDALEAEFNL